MKKVRYLNGAIWSLIFYQNCEIGGLFPLDKVTNNDEPGLFSRLSQIDSLRNKKNSYYTFLLEYPEFKGHNIWLQSRKPIDIKKKR